MWRKSNKEFLRLLCGLEFLVKLSENVRAIFSEDVGSYFGMTFKEDSEVILPLIIWN